MIQCVLEDNKQRRYRTQKGLDGDQCKDMHYILKVHWSITGREWCVHQHRGEKETAKSELECSYSPPLLQVMSVEDTSSHCLMLCRDTQCLIPGHL